MANPELGAKQICPTCQSKFYDLGKRPAHCPKCGTDFDPEEALRSRRSSRRGATPDYDRDDAEAKVKESDDTDTDADELEEEPDNTPELDQAADADVIETDDADEDPGVPSGGEPDLGVGIEEDETLEDDTDDVPFLEDEDEDDFGEDDIEGLPGEDEER